MGATVGIAVGTEVGTSVGTVVGTGVSVGLSVGTAVGVAVCCVGRDVATLVGWSATVDVGACATFFCGAAGAATAAEQMHKHNTKNNVPHPIPIFALLRCRLYH